MRPVTYREHEAFLSYDFGLRWVFISEARRIVLIASVRGE